MPDRDIDRDRLIDTDAVVEHLRQVQDQTRQADPTVNPIYECA